jgi:hypothetical protein
MIAEIRTVSSSGVVISQRRAQRLKQKWNESRLRAQQQIQNAESGQVGMDHPSQSCNQAHPDTSHDEFVIAKHGDDEEEEEEEERSNPLFRQNSASARSISPSRRTRERER